MKKLALLSLFITLTFAGFSQSQRMVLLEHFTQASCGPCATYNPSIHSLLQSNPDKITSINYHTSWPGYDPMYLHNTADPSAKVSYYGVSSVPHSVLDGNFYNGHPASWNINMVNQRYAVPSPFTLSLNQHLSATQDTLFVTMLIEATAAVTGPINAYIAVIEKHIHFNSAPGSNGEKDFYNVLKKLLPTKTGISLPTPMQAGEYYILESFWVLANVYSIDELSVIGFVQNPTTKEIHQSANLNLDPITAVYENDAEVMDFTNMIERYCNNNFSPIFKLRNNGSNNLTDLVIKYQVNDEEIQTYNWTGDLSFLEKELVELPQISFNLEQTNTLRLFIDQVNATNDDYTLNDTIIHVFDKSLQSGSVVEVKIRTDNAPSEVTWEMVNSTGEIIATGGPYTESGITYTEAVPLTENGCYEFFIYDSGGNGLCCGNGTGFFRLASGSTTLAQGTQFGYGVSAQFEATTIDISNPSMDAPFNVYPNPASNLLMIDIPSSSASAKITIVNQLGQEFYQTTVKDGKTEINTSSWPSGLYIIHMESAQQIMMRKVSIVK